MRALQFITDHVIFKLRYNQIYQMKTTLVFEFPAFLLEIGMPEWMSSTLVPWPKIVCKTFSFMIFVNQKVCHSRLGLHPKSFHFRLGLWIRSFATRSQLGNGEKNVSGMKLLPNLSWRPQYKDIGIQTSSSFVKMW